jgi:uncharacterized protein
VPFKLARKYPLKAPVEKEPRNTGNIIMGRQLSDQEVNLSAATASAEDMFELGMRYCLGREVEQDLVSAHKWFNLAALRGSQDARQYRCEISREMSSADIAFAQREARAWLTLH